MLRLTAIALAACTAAGAEPGSAAGATPPAPDSAAHPAGWRQLPAIAAAAAGAARADGVTLAASDAWGDPAAGCYAVWLDLRGGTADPAAIADQVLGGLGDLAPVEIVRPAAGAASDKGAAASRGVLGFAFSRAPYRGRVRAAISAGRVAAVACFGNGREPRACDAACTGVLERVR